MLFSSTILFFCYPLQENFCKESYKCSLHFLTLHPPLTHSAQAFDPIIQKTFHDVTKNLPLFKSYRQLHDIIVYESGDIVNDSLT